VYDVQNNAGPHDAAQEYILYAIFDIYHRDDLFCEPRGEIKERHFSLSAQHHRFRMSSHTHTQLYSGLFCVMRVCVSPTSKELRAARGKTHAHESRLARILMAGRDAAVKTICGFFDRGTFSRCARGGNYHPRPLAQLGSVGRSVFPIGK